MRERLRIGLLVLALLAAVLVVGLTSDADAGPAEPPADKVEAVDAGQIAQQVENLFDGMSCTATAADVGDGEGLLVVTVVCQQKAAARG